MRSGRVDFAVPVGGSSVDFRITGRHEMVDSYAELVIGVFSVLGLLKSHSIRKQVRPGGITQLYLSLVLMPLPLDLQDDIRGNDELPY